MPSSVSQSMRRCPRCKTIGRLYKSHSRNGYERFIEAVFGKVLAKYRCHQCNWRGLMFRKYKEQSRFGFYTMLIGLIFAILIAIALIPQFLLKFVSTFAK